MKLNGKRAVTFLNLIYLLLIYTHLFVFLTNVFPTNGKILCKTKIFFFLLAVLIPA